MDKKRKHWLRMRLLTLISKIQEIQDIERDDRVSVLPSSAEGFKQDLLAAYTDMA